MAAAQRSYQIRQEARSKCLGAGIEFNVRDGSHARPMAYGRSMCTAPASHQKRSHQNAMNAINLQRKCSKINDRVLCLAAHNGLVAGSSPAGPTTRSFKLARTPDGSEKRAAIASPSTSILARRRLSRSNGRNGVQITGFALFAPHMAIRLEAAL
jgi:hypothetical protein